MDEQFAKVIINQFLLHMQNESVWPCHVFIGDDPQQLTVDEVMKIKNDYIKMLTDAGE